MKLNLWLLLALNLLFCYSSNAQTSEILSYKNFPVILTLQFHALSMPFKDLKTNFKNVGIGVGTEWRLNGKRNLVQQLQFAWVRNKAVGNRIIVSTQAVWRPLLSKKLYGELRGGIGYMFNQLPSDGLVYIENEWNTSKRVKGLLHIPIGLGLGYQVNANWSPFINYQTLFVSKYNPGVPIVPETILQLGSKLNID